MRVATHFVFVYIRNIYLNVSALVDYRKQASDLHPIWWKFVERTPRIVLCCWLVVVIYWGRSRVYWCNQRLLMRNDHLLGFGGKEGGRGFVERSLTRFFFGSLNLGGKMTIRL